MAYHIIGRYGDKCDLSRLFYFVRDTEKETVRCITGNEVRVLQDSGAELIEKGSVSVREECMSDVYLRGRTVFSFRLDDSDISQRLDFHVGFVTDEYNVSCGSYHGSIQGCSSDNMLFNDLGTWGKLCSYAVYIGYYRDMDEVFTDGMVRLDIDEEVLKKPLEGGIFNKNPRKIVPCVWSICIPSDFAMYLFSFTKKRDVEAIRKAFSHEAIAGILGINSSALENDFGYELSKMRISCK